MPPLTLWTWHQFHFILFVSSNILWNERRQWTTSFYIHRNDIKLTNRKNHLNVLGNKFYSFQFLWTSAYFVIQIKALKFHIFIYIKILKKAFNILYIIIYNFLLVKYCNIRINLFKFYAKHIKTSLPLFNGYVSVCNMSPGTRVYTSTIKISNIFI